MMTTPATITTLNQSSTNENAPFIITDATVQAILADGPSSWWLANQGTMKGVTSSRAYEWDDIIAGVPATDGIAGINPIQNVEATSRQYVSMGYGGSLAQKNFVLAQVLPSAAGSGWVTGDTAKDPTGTVFVCGSTGGATAWTIKTPATYSAYPTNPVALTAVSPSTGTGATVILDFVAPNGSLQTPAANILIPRAAPFSLVSAFRIPSVGGVAGNTPGGVLIGNSIPQSLTPDSVTGGNTFHTGIVVGYGTSGNAGNLVFHLQGDAKNVFPTTGKLDFRDGTWHVAMADIVPATGVATLWVDGAQIATATFSAGSTISSLAGAQQIRLGAAGAQGSNPVFGLAGDLGDQMIYPIALSGNTAARQRVQNYLMAKFGISGTSA